MTFNYLRLQNTADRLLERFNEQPIQVQRVSGSSVVDGEFTEGTISSFEVIGVVVPRVTSQIANTVIEQGDFQAVIKHDIEPLQGDVFIIDGDRFKAVAVEQYKPSVTKLAYRVQLRK